jgi:dTDP-glucose 4,6-dehydratase
MHHNTPSVLITGGAGFIGSNFVRAWLQTREQPIVNLDKLTYAGNLHNLASIESDPRYTFVQGDICDRQLVRDLLQTHRPCAIVHFAAESHVDRSIRYAADFVQTNVVGTFSLLEEATQYWSQLPTSSREQFRFIHISTDEVYGSLAPDDPAFCEITRVSPNSPYSASKAASDHFVRAYFHTYGLPTITTNCSNNYGPYQFPEKLIPLVIANAIAGKPIPVYGDGLNVRDWLYVADHCSALMRVLDQGRVGETYNIGGRCEMSNIDVVREICALLDELHPESPVTPHAQLITFVTDRPGHDRRYAVDCSKIERELGWLPQETFKSGLRKTISWYLENQAWVQAVSSGAYREWIKTQYAL